MASDRNRPVSEIVEKAKQHLSEKELAALRAREEQTKVSHLKTVQGLQSEIIRLTDDNSVLRLQLSAVLGTLDEFKAKPVSPIVALKKNKGLLPEATLVMMATDWHMGERVRPSQVRGKNEYNPEIAQERAENYFIRCLKLLKMARNGWNVNQIVLWLGGDLMTGYIHEEYLMENFLSPTEEMLLVYQTFMRGIKFILAEYDVERIIIPTSNGNHGRGQQKKITADFRTSYEFLLYQLLAAAFVDEPRVEFQIGQGYENFVTCYGKTIGMHHGDEVMYNSGVGGIYPAYYRRIHRTSAGADAPVVWMIGHHHTLGFAPGAFSNGSLIGPTPFGVNKGYKPEPAQQGIFLMDEESDRPSFMNPVYVDKPTRLAA